MKKILLFASAPLLFAAAASAQQPVMMEPGTVVPPPPMAMQQPPMAAPPAPYCREYTDKFTIAHETRITRGTACMQPDGSWLLQPSSIGMRYVQRGEGLYLVPTRPFAGVVVAAPPVVVIDEHHRHHDHWDH